MKTLLFLAIFATASSTSFALQQYDTYSSDQCPDFGNSDESIGWNRCVSDVFGRDFLENLNKTKNDSPPSQALMPTERVKDFAQLIVNTKTKLKILERMDIYTSESVRQLAQDETRLNEANLRATVRRERLDWSDDQRRQFENLVFLVANEHEVAEQWGPLFARAQLVNQLAAGQNKAEALKAFYSKLSKWGGGRLSIMSGQYDVVAQSLITFAPFPDIVDRQDLAFKLPPVSAPDVEAIEKSFAKKVEELKAKSQETYLEQGYFPRSKCPNPENGQSVSDALTRRVESLFQMKSMNLVESQMAYVSDLKEKLKVYLASAQSWRTKLPALAATLAAISQNESGNVTDFGKLREIAVAAAPDLVDSQYDQAQLIIQSIDMAKLVDGYFLVDGSWRHEPKYEHLMPGNFVDDLRDLFALGSKEMVINGFHVDTAKVESLLADVQLLIDQLDFENRRLSALRVVAAVPHVDPTDMHFSATPRTWSDVQQMLANQLQIWANDPCASEKTMELLGVKNFP